MQYTIYFYKHIIFKYRTRQIKGTKTIGKLLILIEMAIDYKIYLLKISCYG